MDAYSRQIKKKIILVRFTALAASILGMLFIFAFFFNIFDKWLCIIGISYSIAITFMLNSSYQEVCNSVVWKRINMTLAVLGFLATFGIILYAFIFGIFSF